MTNPQNAIEQAIDGFLKLSEMFPLKEDCCNNPRTSNCGNYAECCGEPEVISNPVYEIADKNIAALRALQNVKMRSAGEITHEEARKIAYRFIHSHFDTEGERPTASIPADPKRDDDLRLLEYIEQQEAFHAGLMAQPDEQKIRNQALEEAAGVKGSDLFVTRQAIRALKERK